MQLFAIFSAVSNLSPVNIHIFILAYNKSAIVSGTYYYNLSSTAVAPINVRSLSNSFVILSNSINLYSPSGKLLYSLSNLLYSSSDNILVAINKHLKPILENYSN